MPEKSHRLGVFALAGMLALVGAASAAGKTYEPTRKDDPVPDGCKPNDCSLREAIDAANNKPARDTILLRGGTYEIEIPTGEDSGSLEPNTDVTIRGRGRGKTTIDGNDLDQVFGGFQNGVSDSLVLKALAVTGGNAGGAFHGGAVIVGAPDKLTLDRVLMTGNQAAISGGAITAFGGTVVVKRSIIRDNEATYGGGISFPPTSITTPASALTLRQSTVDGNRASEGGGLDLRPSNAIPVTNVIASTISRNTASNKAGGILADGNPSSGPDYPAVPDVNLVNSTVADNRAANSGGGIIGDNAAMLDIDNSSIGFNQANTDQAGIAVAGGIYQHGNANVSVDDSIIAHNVTLGSGGNDSDCSATEVMSGAGNAISSVFDDGCDASFTPPYNVYTASQIAQNVAGNGGPTETMALTATSDAIGFANNCPKRDQRGRLRPANCDSGAFENRPK